MWRVDSLMLIYGNFSFEPLIWMEREKEKKKKIN
jgi:hypothetical protein